MIDYSFSIGELEYFLIILMRVAGCIFISPFFSFSATPRRVRAALAVVISYLVYYSTLPHETILYETVLEYAIILMREIIVGIMIGFSTMLASSILMFAGRMVDMEIGLSMVNAIDPTSKENATISGMYYQYTVMIILLFSDMHQYIIKALAETFELVSLNGAVFNLDAMLGGFIGFMGDYISIGFRICLPIFCCILISNVILGILAKVAPQMNMFSVGMQIKILFGLSIMGLTTAMLPHVATFVNDEIRRMMVSFVKAMMT